MRLNHLKDQARELVLCTERVVLATLELVEEEMARITWASFTEIIENLLITGVLEASGYIMVIPHKKKSYASRTSGDSLKFTPCTKLALRTRSPNMQHAKAVKKLQGQI